LAVMVSGDVAAACRHAREHQWVFAQLPHGPSPMMTDVAGGQPTPR
jgi:hypothetical protein